MALAAALVSPAAVHGARAATVTEVLRQCACQTSEQCGACTAPRCCGPSRVPATGPVCLEGNDGAVPCRDLQGPLQFSLATDTAGNLYVASNDTNSVYRVTPGGCVTTLIDAAGVGDDPMDGARGLSVDADGSVYVAAGRSGHVFRIARDGTRTKVADAESPIATGVDADGNVYIAATGRTNAVLKVSASGVLEAPVLDSTGDGMATFGAPRGIAVDGDGRIYVAGESSNNVFRIDPDGTKTLILDKNAVGENTLQQPFGVAVDRDRNVYVTGFGSHNLLRVGRDGRVTELFRDGSDYKGPREVAIDASGRVYVTWQNSRQLTSFDPAGGAPEVLVSNTQATPLLGARGLALDPLGRAYVAGQSSNNVWRWDPDEQTACGNGRHDPGEDCDYGVTDEACCCSVTCELLAPGTSCNDGRYCSALDRCDTRGACVSTGSSPCAGPDGDGDCRESCDESTASCESPDPAGTTCTDGNFCNGPDVCTGDGTCQATGANPCASGPECANTCDPRGGGTCLTPPGTACSDDGNACTVEQCDGHGACRSTPGNAGTLCGVATACRAAPTCDGVRAACPAGTPVEGACSVPGCDPNRSVCLNGECECRPDLPAGCGDGGIDPGEVCGEPGLPDGPCCAGCRFAASGATCRAATSVCDPAEVCNGFSADCPANGFAPPETPCEDGDPCTDGDVCVSGTCRSIPVCGVAIEGQRTLAAASVSPGAAVTRAVCTNPVPSQRRATSCTAKGYLVHAADTGTSRAASLDCLALPPGAASPATRRQVRRFARDNDGGSSSPCRCA